MTLLEHIKACGLTMPEAAAQLDEPESTIRKIAYRQRQPSLPLAVKIASWSDGAVTEADLLLPGAPTAAARVHA